MELSQELKKIKKVYGEKFMHLCRELFPTLLETEGKLFEILTKTFSNNSRSLCDDIINSCLKGAIKNYIYSKIDMEAPEVEIIQSKTPYELLDEAGYDLYECITEEQIQSFIKYYAYNEELCTFNGGRLEMCDVFFAVRKDVDEIKREDYKSPRREDKYGTSVMSIQFNRVGRCTVSIKNRYNHRVNNPDATYGNDLDRIIPGLEKSFANLLEERGLELNNSNKEEFELPKYVVAGDGKYYKYNYEIGGIYYCPGNIIIENGEVNKLKEHEVLLDYFVLNLKEKTLRLHDKCIRDSFGDAFNDGITKIEVTKNKDKGDGARTIKIFVEGKVQPVIIDINEENEIVGYENVELREVGDGFLSFNEELRELNMPQLQSVGNSYLFDNRVLREVNMPQLKSVGNSFLYNNRVLSKIDMPQLQRAGNSFLEQNRVLRELNTPQLQQVGDNFIYFNHELKELNMPQLQRVGNDFLYINENVEAINMPQLQEVGNKFFGKYSNKEVFRLIKRGYFKSIDSYDLSVLDKETELTTSEVSGVSRLFSKIKNVVKNLIER